MKWSRMKHELQNQSKDCVPKLINSGMSVSYLHLRIDEPEDEIKNNQKEAQAQQENHYWVHNIKNGAGIEAC